MKQYLDILKEIKEKGTVKPAARLGMPSTTSLFGAQFRHDLKDGFPLLTTKKIKFDHIITELLWFLRGDTNIKYLVDNGCNIWSEDAYNYYLKLCKENLKTNFLSFEDFIFNVKHGTVHGLDKNYRLGDCGWQYGRLWRSWNKESYLDKEGEFIATQKLDQISELINGLKNNPESRRHLITALNPAHYNDLALFPCHVLAQFNARPLTFKERCNYLNNTTYPDYVKEGQLIDECGDIPKYYLDCQMYQRSADVFLGVPYNIASYALLTHILSEICGMIPGEMIYTYGDVHIYENHGSQVDEQLSRIPSELPTLKISDNFKNQIMECMETDVDFTINDAKGIEISMFSLQNYNTQPSIKAKLSTGLK